MRPPHSPEAASRYTCAEPFGSLGRDGLEARSIFAVFQAASLASITGRHPQDRAPHRPEPMGYAQEDIRLQVPAGALACSPWGELGLRSCSLNEPSVDGLVRLCRQVVDERRGPADYRGVPRRLVRVRNVERLSPPAGDCPCVCGDARHRDHTTLFRASGPRRRAPSRSLGASCLAAMPASDDHARPRSYHGDTHHITSNAVGCTLVRRPMPVVDKPMACFVPRGERDIFPRKQFSDVARAAGMKSWPIALVSSDRHARDLLSPGRRGSGRDPDALPSLFWNTAEETDEDLF